MFIPASIVHPFLLLPNLFLVLCCQPAFLLHYVASMLAMLEVINWCKYCISLLIRNLSWYSVQNAVFVWIPVIQILPFLFNRYYRVFPVLCPQAGHPFQQRCAQSAYSNSKQKWEAPVFLLFLDCVWQILRQFPCSFEFNCHFLIMLFEHSYASQFGTFLGNNENER